MKDAKDVVPWKVTNISIRPYDGYWSFNPSIHFDGQIWRCVLRCCDYAMPEGRTIRSKSAGPMGQQTKNAMVIFDPASWRPIQIYKMHEKDGLPRATTPHVGYEDMRIFKTDRGGLQGIAASLHLRRESRSTHGGPKNQPPEQVLLSFDGEYNIVAARPIRGDGWSGSPQKNWVPFDHCEEPRFLYSIDKGTVFGGEGALHGDRARVKPSASSRPIGAPVQAMRSAPAAAERPAESPAEATPVDRPPQEAPRAHGDQSTRKVPIRSGGDVHVRRVGRIALDAMASRPSSRAAGRPSIRPGIARRSDDSTRVMGSGRVLLPKYNGLRGGTQLVRVADDAWLGIGHEMKFVNSKKLYWHTWYLVDALGKMTRASEPMKLAPNGIEFAAGMAIDGDRVVVSFGVDDMECRIGETRLSAVMEALRPVDR